MVLVSTALVAGIVALNMRADVRHERDIVQRDLAHRGEAAAARLESSLAPEKAAGDTMRQLVQQPDIAQVTARCSAVLDPLQRVVPGGYVAVVDHDGVIRCAAGDYRQYVGKPVLAQVGAVRTVLSSAVIVTEGPFRDPILGELAMATGIPLPRPSTASLLFVFATQHGLLQEDPGGTGTATVVHGPTGLVLAHRPEQQGVAGRPAADSGLGAIAGREGLVAATGPDGVERLYASTRVPGTDVWVLVSESKEAAFSAAESSLRRNAALAGLLLLTLAASGLVLQRNVARPARRLRQAMTALAYDPAAPPAPTQGPLELAAVARAFNTAAEARRRADGLTRALVEHATDLLLVVDARGTLTYVAPAAQRLLGACVGDSPLKLARLVHLAERERLLRSVQDWLRGGASELRTELRVRDLGGQVHHLDVHAQDLRRDPDVLGIVLAARDDTDRKRAEEDLAFRARHDALTGLANRARILDELRSCLLEAAEAPVAVLFLDLDRFKLINDSHGHGVGDQVLVTLADRLFRLTGAGDIVGRLGGDEFVLIAPSVSTPEDAMLLADRVRTALEGPIAVAQRELFVSGSVGVAFGEAGDNASTVLRNADTAMYRAKQLGRNCAALYDEEMQREARRLLRTEVDLHRALEREELVVHYQPVVALGRDQVIGAEALVRWRHPSRGLIPPSEFVPVAEETGLIVPIGRFVLEQACTFAAANPALGYVAVNISPRQLAQPDVVNMVRSVLHRTGLAPSRLCLEVTETLLVQDAAAAAVTLQALHADGVRVAIDDFGTGWASLTYLQQFPVDTIKLDRSFVSQVTEDSVAAAIVASLIQLAHSMGMTVTGEGVESHGQAEFLRDNRCDSGQGFLFARALPGEELRLALASRPQDQVPQPRVGRSA